MHLFDLHMVMKNVPFSYHTTLVCYSNGDFLISLIQLRSSISFFQKDIGPTEISETILASNQICLKMHPRFFQTSKTIEHFSKSSLRQQREINDSGHNISYMRI